MSRFRQNRAVIALLRRWGLMLAAGMIAATALAVAWLLPDRVTRDPAPVSDLFPSGRSLFETVDRQIPLRVGIAGVGLTASLLLATFGVRRRD